MKSPKAKMKDSAWEWFSKWIRLRDCLITTGTKDKGLCITCGKMYGFKQLQAGHFLAGRGNSILFEEFNCHAQCYGCNIGRSGDQYEYGLKMVKMYGQEEIDRLRLLKNGTKHFTLGELTELRDYYKNEFKDTYENN